MLILAMLFTVWIFWAGSGRDITPLTYTGTIAVHEFGIDSGKGNVIGIQPYVYPQDYSSEETFAAAMDVYLQAAAAQDWLHEKTIVVFPEFIGTWLVLMGEKKSVFEANTVDGGMAVMAVSNLFSMLPLLMNSKAEDKAADALFRMKASRMAEVYHNTFSAIAKKYNVTVVAGSIVLPETTVENHQLKVSGNQLFNLSILYHPDGSPDPRVIKKAFPIADELPFICKAEPDKIPVFETSAGTVGVLICADSWFPEAYQNLKQQQAQVAIVPSYVVGNGSFKTPWPGYSGFDNAADVNLEDIGSITILDAWVKYALPTRASQAQIPNGMIVFLNGKLWDIGADSHIVLLQNGEFIVLEPDADASVVNLWL